VEAPESVTLTILAGAGYQLGTSGLSATIAIDDNDGTSGSDGGMEAGKDASPPSDGGALDAAGSRDATMGERDATAGPDGGPSKSNPSASDSGSSSDKGAAGCDCRAASVPSRGGLAAWLAMIGMVAISLRRRIPRGRAR